MGRLARHRVLLGCRLGNHASGVVQFGHVNQRIVGHHALVHAVERQSGALRIPEQAALDAELVAVHALAIDQLTRAVAGHLARVAVAVGDIEVIVLDKRHGMAALVPFLGHHTGVAPLPPLHLAGLEVDEQALMVVVEQCYGLVGIGEGHIVEAVDLRRFFGQAGRLVEAVAGEEHLLLALGGIHGPASVLAEAHQLVAPPGEGPVGRNHVAVICAAEVQVLERELFLSHSRQGQQGQQQ